MLGVMLDQKLPPRIEPCSLCEDARHALALFSRRLRYPYVCLSAVHMLEIPSLLHQVAEQLFPIINGANNLSRRAIVISSVAYYRLLAAG
jgi:hypothetical protein